MVSLASSVSINVYLKLKPKNQIAQLITEFTQFLEQKGVLNQYQISPFISHYPLHITLYLTDYESKQIPKIMEQVQTIAKLQKPLWVSSSEFSLKNKAYLMLSVNRTGELDTLSKTTLAALVELRDKNAAIPVWASADKDRQELFKQYGSPNVLDFFNPHFSVLGPVNLDPQSTAALTNTLQHFIKVFSTKQQTGSLAKAYALGVGLADAQGQIVKELSVFPFHYTKKKNR
ncbi:MAG: hypothetical protein ACHP6H_01995 [Legionellales bacterium]